MRGDVPNISSFFSRLEDAIWVTDSAERSEAKWHYRHVCGSIGMGVALSACVWLYRHGCGTIGMCVALSAWVWLYRHGCGSIGMGMALSAWVWLYRHGCGSIGMGAECSHIICQYIRTGVSVAKS